MSKCASGLSKVNPRALTKIFNSSNQDRMKPGSWPDFKL